MQRPCVGFAAAFEVWLQRCCDLSTVKGTCQLFIPVDLTSSRCFEVAPMSVLQRQACRRRSVAVLSAISPLRTVLQTQEQITHRLRMLLGSEVHWGPFQSRVGSWDMCAALCFARLPCWTDLPRGKCRNETRRGEDGRKHRTYWGGRQRELVTLPKVALVFLRVVLRAAEPAWERM